MTEKEYADRAFDWWTALSEDSGKRARMRRQSDIIGIQMTDAFYDLVRSVPEVHDLDTLACVAMVLSHIDRESGDTVAHNMGHKSKAADHAVSESRFRRLMESGVEDASRLLVRMLPMIENTADVRDAAVTIRYWDNPNQLSKKRWIKQYYLSNEKNVNKEE